MKAKTLEWHKCLPGYLYSQTIKTKMGFNFCFKIEKQEVDYEVEIVIYIQNMTILNRYTSNYLDIYSNTVANELNSIEEAKQAAQEHFNNFVAGLLE